MRRREFIATLVGAATMPRVARAQQAGKHPIVGFLDATSPTTQISTVFVQRLRELGWVDGRNIAVMIRWAEGRRERYAEIATEFVRANVDVIATVAVPAVIATKHATSSIPIVFVAGDPVGNGLVSSLSRPGGNATGLSSQSSDLAGKRVELLREVVPTLRRLAILVNASAPNAVLEKEEVQAAARALGIDAVVLEIRHSNDIDPAFAGLKERADGLYVVIDPLTNTSRVHINKLALGARIPTMHSVREFVEAAGLMSYGPNLPDLYRRMAVFVDKILRGAKPGDLPVEQPTKFDLTINLTTARTLGLEVPLFLQQRADEVIE
jgi:putative tryptophan/tyrosine transport system substrate-binding protein